MGDNPGGKSRQIFDDRDTPYGSANPLVSYILFERIDAVLALIGKAHGKILDAGCGEGHFLERLRKEGQKSVYGIDLSEKRVLEARKRAPHATVKRGDVTKIPFSNGFFDTVVCMDVLEHLDEPWKATSELMRVTKKGGRVIVSVPHERNVSLSRLFTLRFPPHVPEHINEISPGDLERAFGRKPHEATTVPANLPYQLALIYVASYRK